MSDGSWNRVPIEPQSVNAPLSASAIFLVVTIGETDEALATARSVIADMGAPGIRHICRSSFAQMRAFVFSLLAAGYLDVDATHFKATPAGRQRLNAVLKHLIA